MTQPTLPLLYSFRRCPYAMRARLGLYLAGIDVELREIELKAKPEHMLELNPVGTVPTLQFSDGQVNSESLEIMIYALEQAQSNLLDNLEASLELISINDGPFKKSLDGYKYPQRNLDKTEQQHRQDALEFALLLNSKLTNGPYLQGTKASLADFAIAPFIRQFAHVDRAWFDGLDLKPLQTWLEQFKQSEAFLKVMPKFEPYLKNGKRYSLLTGEEITDNG
ncbi:glutathione S-transferase [Paraferrimonas sp. SM1919]|uniref:glutathione S-transferase n=1 Tax=Paraferrimonas sp. SM1919 TaxID=2662263 RepID=UPI0013D62A0C|nr:glutathione S-transferase [Paraferrimonas sp. SM1919]